METDHFYIFYVDKEGRNTHDRTCGTEERAREVVAELKKIHPDAFYTLNELPKQFYY